MAQLVNINSCNMYVSCAVFATPHVVGNGVATLHELGPSLYHGR